MLLKLYQTGQPVLRNAARKLSKSELSSERVQNLIELMITTLRDAPGVGLAAPQVGESLQIIVVEDLLKYHEIVPSDLLAEQGRKPVDLQVLVNPKLEVLDSSEALYFEGCLSVDGYCAAVPRALGVRVSALDRSGNPISLEAHGWQARILQHEIDHLHGALYIDTMKHKSFMTTKHFSLEWRKKLTAAIGANFS